MFMELLKAKLGIKIESGFKAPTEVAKRECGDGAKILVLQTDGHVKQAYLLGKDILTTNGNPYPMVKVQGIMPQPPMLT